MKRVLLISYWYPPCNSPGSRRSGSMAKYLGEYGWQPVVVTNHWTTKNCSYDPDCVQNLPEGDFVRRIQSSNLKNGGFFGFLNEDNWQKVLRPMKHPTNWSGNVKRSLTRLADLKNIDAIWATYCPNANLYLARYFSKKIRVPWVADFRDEPGQFGTPEDIRYRFMVYRMIAAQRRLIKSAAAITTVTKGLSDTLKDRYQREVHVIMNGFDPEDTAKEEKIICSKFTLVHTGELYPQRSPKPIFDALAMLIKKGEIATSDISIKFYGQDYILTENNDFFLPHLLKNYPFSEIVTSYQRVSRKECDEICRSSTILLLIRESGKGFIPSKLFSYLAARRPILALSNNSNDVQQIIYETGAGECCNTLLEIANLLLKWYKEWKITGTVNYSGKGNSILRFSRKEQAKQLVELLDEVVSES